MSSLLPFGMQKSAAHVAVAPKLKGAPSVRAVAFYLPQFHPIPENDENWGEGFTEWTNVTRGLVEFTDHHQPRAPANYGFYDLRVPQIQVRQARDAKAAGISAFCYYHYWFDGHMPLTLPLVQHRDNTAIDLPFCLCFANENWTKRWDGLEDQLILKQKYGKDFANRFWADLLPYLRSDKYLRDQQGRPILLIYRPSIIPQFSRIAASLRHLAKADGFEGLHLVGGLGFEKLSSLTEGLDSFYEFPPLNSYARTSFGAVQPKVRVHGQATQSRTSVHDYRQFVMMERLLDSSPAEIHPAVMPDWDNVARRPFAGNAFVDAKPSVFEEWTRRAAARAARTKERLLFVNAWNEWAEGAYLEPDQRYGWAYLSAFSRGIDAARAQPRGDPQKPVAVFVHVHYQDIWEEIRELLAQRMNVPFNVILTTSTEEELARPETEFCKGLEIHRLENRGRDILPFLTAMSKTRFDFDIGLKLHTKRSPHRVDGQEWRRMLIGDLVPATGAKGIVSLLRTDPNIGLVSPEEHWTPVNEHVGSNLDVMIAVMARLGYDFSHRDLDQARFIAGSMFWFRRDALRAADVGKLRNMFSKEQGQLDGTPAHAMERLFSLLGERGGFVTVSTNEVGSLSARLREDEYPLPDRLNGFSDQVAGMASGNRIALSRVDNVPPSAVPASPGYSAVALKIRRSAANNRIVFTVYHRLPFAMKRRINRWFGFPYP